MSENIFANLGMTNVNRIVTAPPPIIVSKVGYTRAERILSFNCSELSKNCASLKSITSSTPPSSPALTILTYNLEKTLGYFERASANVLPPWTFFWTLSKIDLNLFPS